MAKTNPQLLQGSETNVAYTTGSATTFTLSQPTLNAPSGYGGNAFIYILRNNSQIASANTLGDFQTYSGTGAESGVFTYLVQVIDEVEALKPGVYTVSSTLTCVGQ
jgi:hypothetical protein